MNKKFFTATLSLGFALFSMFFGSGNLVFPIYIGKLSEGLLFSASVGLLLTAIIIPFLGAAVLWLRDGDSSGFFMQLGPKGDYWFPLLALSIMGPFGVLPRCMTVAHGSITSLIPTLSLGLFSFVFCATIFFVTYNKSLIIPILGKILTPLLLISLCLIGIFGIYQSPSLEIPAFNFHKSLNTFTMALKQGYQTMDLLAAFFFSIFALEHINKLTGFSQKERNKIFVYACFIGAMLLSLCYLMLIYLGASYVEILSQIPAEQLLAKVAFSTLGNQAATLLCIAVVLACLTTAVVLSELFANFIHERVISKRISYPACIFITLLISWTVTHLKFSGIAAIISPVLEILYPALMVLTLLEVARKSKPDCKWITCVKNWPVFLTFISSLFSSLFFLN